MPYDPTLPQAGTEIDAVQMRAQLNGLKDLIDAIQTITAAQVDATHTLDPGEPATAEASWNDGEVHFTFGIPRGNDGGEGAPGPPFASAVVDGVTTLDPGEPATVDSTFDGTTVHLTFAIPRGDDGGPGPQGEPGAPGEVSLQQLTDAIATTSSNTNAVATLGMTVSDPPTQSEVQQIADKIDELIVMLRR